MSSTIETLKQVQGDDGAERRQASIPNAFYLCGA